MLICKQNISLDIGTSWIRSLGVPNRENGNFLAIKTRDLTRKPNSTFNMTTDMQRTSGDLLSVITVYSSLFTIQTNYRTSMNPNHYEPSALVDSPTILTKKVGMKQCSKWECSTKAVTLPHFYELQGLPHKNSWAGGAGNAWRGKYVVSDRVPIKSMLAVSTNHPESRM